MPRSKHRASRRRARPAMEGLEDRKLLYATLGANWAYGTRITYSFAPDGTNVGGNPSSLYSAMAAKGFSASQWQGAIQKAAAAWEAAANVNLVLVADNGAAFGSAGDQQGDGDFGDIRIGGTALSPSVLASCFLPPSFNGGTLAGDIVFNTTQAWQINNDYDLQTVAIHEIGHALGLDHSALSTVDLYASYTGQKQSLQADDIAGIQAIYGAHAADAYDSASSNNSSTTATNVTPLLDGNKQASIPALDITSSTDCDWFVVTAPAGTSGTLTVTMQSSNLSALSPKVLLYNASLAGLSQAAATNAFGATVSVTISGVTAGQKFYVKCQAANGGSTGIGAYGLQLNFGSGTMVPIPPPNTTVASAADRGGGAANEQVGDELALQIGSLRALGDDLKVDARYRLARQIVDGQQDAFVIFADPRQAARADAFVDFARAAAGSKNAKATRAAAISAVELLLALRDR